MTDQFPGRNYAYDKLAEGSSTRDPEAINAALREQFNVDAPPDEQPLRLAGSQPVSDTAKPPTAPADALRPVEPPAVREPEEKVSLPVPRPGGAPAWFKIPPGFEFPRGRVVYFIRFEAEWTDTPWKGERQLCMWSMGVGDKKLAFMRSMGDALRARDELLKSTIRITDGKAVTLEDGSLDVWWDEIGERCRTLLNNMYGQLHVLKPQQIDHFLKDCVEARSVG